MDLRSSLPQPYGSFSSGKKPIPKEGAERRIRGALWHDEYALSWKLRATLMKIGISILEGGVCKERDIILAQDSAKRVYWRFRRFGMCEEQHINEERVAQSFCWTSSEGRSIDCDSDRTANGSAREAQEQKIDTAVTITASLEDCEMEASVADSEMQIERRRDVGSDEGRFDAVDGEGEAGAIEVEEEVLG